MAIADHMLKNFIKRQKLFMFLSCVSCMLIIFYMLSSDNFRAYAITNLSTEKQLEQVSIPTVSRLKNSELAKVIASSGLLNRLYKAIIAILKTDIEKQEGRRLESKEDSKFQQAQVTKPKTYPTYQPLEDHKVTPLDQNTSIPDKEPKSTPLTETSRATQSKIDPIIINCTEQQLFGLEKIFHVNEVQCDKLISGDHNEMYQAQNILNHTNREMLQNEFYINSSANCTDFKRSRGYITCPLTREEEDFPIAYSILIFKDIEMVERLLRSIYRPQNYYCIHVDNKSDPNFFQAINDIVSCFKNVFIPPERIGVQWGKFSVLEPELVCMKHLWKYNKWKYFINLTGQEFPLKTNWELVQILKAYNGANDLEGTIRRNMVRGVIKACWKDR